MQTETTQTFVGLLNSAIAEPGKIHTAYTRFHNYSLGNQLLAMIQCAERGIEPGPIATYPAWQALKRQVTKGSKAISLWQPISVQRERENAETGETDTIAFTRFICKPRWFVLSQTEGETYTPATLPEWNTDRALDTLKIERTAFTMTDGNCQGFAVGRKVSVSPIAAMPFRTLVHEIAHVVLGHTTESAMQDGETTPRNIGEVEAEGAAYLVCAVLEQDGMAYSRGYLQHWLRGQDISERSAQKIFKTADAILKAGRLEVEPAGEAV